MAAPAQRIFYIFVATVRDLPPDFFDYPVQVDGYGRRGALIHLKLSPLRRYSLYPQPLCVHIWTVQFLLTFLLSSLAPPTTPWPQSPLLQRVTP